MQAQLSKPIWFDMKTYQTARTFGFQEWALQIGNRFYLRTLLDASKLTAEQLNAARDSENPAISDLEAKELGSAKLEQFDKEFKRLNENPFVDLGFKGTYIAPAYMMNEILQIQAVGFK
jgi:hypothetical protein